MRILVTNDDGIASEGLKTLASVLVKKGHNVIVVAPDGNRSAFSHSLSIHKNLVFTTLGNKNGYDEYTLDGTPADCVKFACHYFEKTPFDLVCSGINLGNNLGSDTCYSGTVSAGLEANFFEIKSIAFSNVAHHDQDFAANARVIDKYFEKFLEISSPEYTLNVNMPNGEDKGVKLARLGSQRYSDEYQKIDDGSYVLTGVPVPYDKERDSDVVLSREGYVTVTPIVYDRTAYFALNNLKESKF